MEPGPRAWTPSRISWRTGELMAASWALERIVKMGRRWGIVENLLWISTDAIARARPESTGTNPSARQQAPPMNPAAQLLIIQVTLQALSSFAIAGGLIYSAIQFR